MHLDQDLEYNSAFRKKMAGVIGEDEMGDVKTIFVAGSVVVCTTALGETIEGEVIAFDYTRRVLVLKRSASSQQANQSDVHLLNLQYVKDIKIKKEVKRDSEVLVNLPPLNVKKLEERLHSAVHDRQRLIAAFTSGVSQDGVRLFLTLSKTFNSVTWDKQDILCEKVRICPPYKPKDCAACDKSAASQKSVEYLQTLVQRFWDDQEKQQPKQPSSGEQNSTSQGPPHPAQSGVPLKNPSPSPRPNNPSEKKTNSNNNSNQESVKNATSEKTTSSQPSVNNGSASSPVSNSNSKNNNSSSLSNPSNNANSNPVTNEKTSASAAANDSTPAVATSANSAN